MTLKDIAPHEPILVEYSRDYGFQHSSWETEPLLFWKNGDVIDPSLYTYNYGVMFYDPDLGYKSGCVILGESIREIYSQIYANSNTGHYKDANDVGCTIINYIDPTTYERFTILFRDLVFFNCCNSPDVITRKRHRITVPAKYLDREEARRIILTYDTGNKDPLTQALSSLSPPIIDYYGGISKSDAKDDAKEYP